MELKLICDCGQKYKFDVEPVNGQMPFAVNCPVCGVDGTPLANQLLTRQLSADAPVPALIPSMAAPSPVAVDALRINRQAQEAVPPPVSVRAVPPPPPGAPLRRVIAVKTTTKGFSMGLGTLGAVLGSVLGALAVYGFFVWADFKFPLSGTGVGLLAGFGARMLARGTDSTLGLIAGAITGAAVMGVFYLIYLQFGVFYVSAIISAVIGAFLANRIAS